MTHSSNRTHRQYRKPQAGAGLGQAFTIAVALTLSAVTTSSAQGWEPSDTIRLVVPYGPGGSSDIIARTVAAEMSKDLGHQVVVENLAGAAGVVAMQNVAGATADGHTMVLGHVGTLAVNPAMLEDIPYDAKNDFAPVALLTTVPMLFVVNSDVEAETLEQFVDLAKAEPGSMNYGSAGNGSAGHLAFEQLKLAAGIDVQHIPYKGTGAQITDLLAGRTDAASAGVPPFLPHLRSGALRVLAVGSAERIPLLPDVPTVAETGYPGFESSQWFGLMVPAGTPQPVIDRLNRSAVAALQQPTVVERLREDASVAIGSTAEEFAAFIDAESARWGEIVRKADLQAE